MPTFQKLPLTVEAVQFTGDNWAEMHDFTGHFTPPGKDTPMDVFIEYPTPVGNLVARIWVAANKGWLGIEVGEWVIKDSLGFYPCKDRVFNSTYVRTSEEPIPVLDDTDDLARLLGRARYALIVARRPMSEVEHISNTLATIVAEHKVLMELHPVKNGG